MMNDPLIGQQLANYRIDRLLGRGGMARVYFGWDISLDRPVAVKVIDERWRDDPAYTSRFISEARTIASWRHENIIQVFYADQQDGVYFFTMEYINGVTLEDLMEDYVQSGELMPHEDVLRIARSITKGLDYAHQKGVIHRDMKPANILIDRDDRVVISDFGLALTLSKGTVGEIFGTPHYISPEQARSSASAVTQSDLYSLAVILYEMLTGVVPFDDPSISTLALKHLTEEPPKPTQINPNLNGQTEAVLLKGLAKNPDDRYQTGAELLSALESALMGSKGNIPALPPMPAGVIPPSERKMSRVSVSERIAQKINMEAASPPQTTIHTPKPKGSATVQQQRENSQKKTDPKSGGLSLNYVLAGIVSVLIIGGIGILIGLSMFGNRNDSNESSGTALTITDTVPAEISASPIPATTSAPIEIAATAVPTDIPTNIPPTDIPTNIPPTDIPASPTLVLPTATNIPSSPIPSTDLPAPTEAPLLPEVIAPTVLYPDGHLIQFVYNDSGFYAYNASNESVRPSQMTFEALDASGNVQPYAFDGGEWSVAYRFLESRKCDMIEITSMAINRPGFCGNFNSLRTFTEDDNRNFWFERPNVTQFRLLWNDNEVGRCEVGAGVCEIRVPIE